MADESFRVFDARADLYDRWYDSPVGRAAFDAESACLKRLGGDFRGRWLEVGVGTGRFASRLGISEGIDPSRRMLAIAAGRGVRTYEGRAEGLPFPDGTFGGILLALTLCFVDGAGRTLGECRRSLGARGKLLLGIIPVEGPWGKEYTRKATGGHPIWTRARFRTAEEAMGLARNAGFTLKRVSSTLFWNPGEDAPQEKPRIETGIVPGAGFLGLLFDAA